MWKVAVVLSLSHELLAGVLFNMHICLGFLYLWELIRTLKQKTWPCLFKSWGTAYGTQARKEFDQTSFALKGYWRWKLTVRKQMKNANHSIFSFSYAIKYFNFFFFKNWNLLFLSGSFNLIFLHLFSFILLIYIECVIIIDYHL